MRCRNTGFAGHWMMDRAEAAKVAPVRWLSVRVKPKRPAQERTKRPRTEFSPDDERRLINARFDSVDRQGNKVRAGDLIYYYPASGAVELYESLNLTPTQARRLQWYNR